MMKVQNLPELDFAASRFSNSVFEERMCIITGGIGGEHGLQVFRNAFALCLKTWRWTELPQLNEPRAVHTSVVMKDNVFVVGGFVSVLEGRKVDTIECLNIKALEAASPKQK